jgi:transcriptional regulator with XRE-family HTH domain
MAEQTAYRDDKIRAVMAAKRLTNDEVAEKTGLTRQTIGQIREGKVDAKTSTLALIATALEIELSELFEPRAA